MSAAHPVWELLNDSYSNGTLLPFRLTTRQRTLVPLTASTVTAAASSSGTVSFVGGDPARSRLQLGSVITFGTSSPDRRAIQSISNPPGNVVTVEGSTAISATRYSIDVPALRWIWDAEILMSPAKHFSLDSAGQLAGTLSMQPDVDIDDPTLVY